MGDQSQLTVDGVALNLKSDLVDMFRRQLQGEWVFASKTTLGPEDGVGRVIGATRGTALEARVRDAVVKLVTDQDPKVRAGAIASIDTYARSFDGAELLMVLDQWTDLFRGVPALASGFPDLEWELLGIVAATGFTSPAFRERLRKAALDKDNGIWVLANLTRMDPQWVTDHAAEAAAAEPNRAVVVLTNLQDPRHRRSFLEALRTQTEEFRQQLASKLERPIRDPAERERLRKLLTG